MNIFNPFIKRGPRKIIFVYSEKYKNTGSTIMRGRQLSDIAKRYTPKSYSISFEPLSLGVNDAILFLTKGAIYSLDADMLRRLKEQNNWLIFDPVDAPLAIDKFKFADSIVSASRTAYKSYLGIFKKDSVHIVDHHVDPRIRSLKINPQTTFRVGYFGELSNTLSTSLLKKQVDFIGINTEKQESSWIEKIPQYSLHYAIRNTKNTRHKPFLKGFIAAHIGANILIQESEKEAVHWLGKDYPFLLKGAVTEKNILESLEQAKSKWNKPDWYRGLEIMESIKNSTRDEVIANQLISVFRRAH